MPDIVIEEKTLPQVNNLPAAVLLPEIGQEIGDLKGELQAGQQECMDELCYIKQLTKCITRISGYQDISSRNAC
ncbi:hypothetical protein PghCCS26_46510 [Paenibacillus glycanilyticus]|uniref:Uncharacterized protein n=1 Tax=Paenibacillus glycanilyticus TaxID=126569 RepID=A0ABQ6NR11_9BACL|nr:hypothetical protein PghCCS26_46510 [Paenibacillus glycanilyticus]